MVDGGVSWFFDDLAMRGYGSNIFRGLAEVTFGSVEGLVITGVRARWSWAEDTQGWWRRRRERGSLPLGIGLGHDETTGALDIIILVLDNDDIDTKDLGERSLEGHVLELRHAIGNIQALDTVVQLIFNEVMTIRRHTKTRSITEGILALERRRRLIKSEHFGKNTTGQSKENVKNEKCKVCVSLYDKK